MGLYGVVYLLLSVNAEAVAVRFSTHTPVRLICGFMMLMALLAFDRHLTGVALSECFGEPFAHGHQDGTREPRPPLDRR